jgi:cellulose synthase/poly-beta-1,6-N-acetylglucosamine synthase-like glycosyltransferase
VQYRRLDGSRPVRSSLLVLTALLFVGGFLAWLMLPSHWPHLGDDVVVNTASIAMTVTTGIIGWFAFLNVATLCRATLLARDPVPVRPAAGQRVAFLTTIVPQAESLDLVRPTLEAALQIRHHGQLDVWLLDEGDDDEVKALCAELGVNHFTRRGVERWNEPSGPNKAKSKHGNYNAWLEAHGEQYDFMLGVDPDHVPLANFAERFLGYFRDPDVAFVVGPQVYGNYQGFIVRAAESQQFLFHSLLQRAGNRSRTPMLVGTNNALRVSALKQIGGFQDSITEDMATSLVFHASRNPETSKRWTSVYTPDVVAVGEGPASFTDYFSQQDRWSRGTDEVLARRFWQMGPRLGPRALVHYALLTCYYPTAAIAWVLGAVNAILYFTLGAGGVVVPAHLWLMLYVDAAALQVGLYFFNRRHNVSPHEKTGSAGVAGMLISALSAPIYAASLAAVLLRRTGGFVTTPKGDASTRDTILTFRKHLIWAGVFGVPLMLSFVLGHHHMSMRAWSIASLVVCLLPVAIWRVERARMEKEISRREERPQTVRAEIKRESVRAEGPEPARVQTQPTPVRVVKKADPARAEKPEPAKPSGRTGKKMAPAATPARAAAPAAAPAGAAEAAKAAAALKAKKRDEALKAAQEAAVAKSQQRAEALKAERAAKVARAAEAAEAAEAAKVAEAAAAVEAQKRARALKAKEARALKAEKAAAAAKAAKAAESVAAEAEQAVEAPKAASAQKRQPAKAKKQPQRAKATPKAKAKPKPASRQPAKKPEPAREEQREETWGSPPRFERRKRHEHVRFDRRAPVTDEQQDPRRFERSRPVRHEPEPAGEPAGPEKAARRKEHIIVHFDKPQPARRDGAAPARRGERLRPEGHEPEAGEQTELTWQIFDRVEA